MTIADQIVTKLKLLSPEQQRELLDFAEFLTTRPGNGVHDAARAEEEERRIGIAGAILAAQVVPAEDFSDWEEPDGGAKAG